MRVATVIELTDAERAELSVLIRSKLTSVRLSQRARIVLLAADGMPRATAPSRMAILKSSKCN